MSESASASKEDKALPTPAVSQSSSTPKEERTDLPPPIEIAKVAAILSRGRNLDRKEAIDEAIAWCLEAGFRYAELVELPLDQIFREVGDTALRDWGLALVSRSKKLRLYPDNARVDPETRIQFFDGNFDEARSYLHKKLPYLNMKKTRSVLFTIKLYFLKTAHDHNRRNRKKIEKVEKRCARLAKKRTKKIGRPVTIDEIRNGMQLWDDQIRRDGNHEYDDFMDRAAVRAEGTSEGHHFRPGKVFYWELPESFLDKLVRFRLDVKKMPGGIRSLQSQLRAKTQQGKKTELRKKISRGKGNRRSKPRRPAPRRSTKSE